MGTSSKRNPRSIARGGSLALWGLIGVFLGCASSQTEIEPDNRQAIQTRLFKQKSIQEIYSEAKKIIRREGFKIVTKSKKEATLVGQVRFGKSEVFRKGLAKTADLPIRQGEQIEVTVSLVELEDGVVAARMSLRRMPEYSLGYVEGEEITVEKPYARLFGFLEAGLHEVATRARNRLQDSGLALPPLR